MLHAACASRMQFMLMHAVHGMKCRAFSMLCWGYTRRTSLKTSILSLLHSKTIDLAASSGQNPVSRNSSLYPPRISWVALGALLDALGALWAALGALLTALGTLLGRFGVALGALGLLLVLLGAPTGSTWLPCALLGALAESIWLQANAPTTAPSTRLAKKNRFAFRRSCFDAACFVRSGTFLHASNLVKYISR